MQSFLRALAASATIILLTSSCSLDRSALGAADGSLADSGPRECRPGTVDVDGDPSNGCECILSTPPEEVCNNADDDCDGTVDEGLTRTCGATVGACVAGEQACVAGIWSEECTGEVTPSPEQCDGSLDENCDGSVDEGCSCTAGESRPCGVDAGECVTGTQSCGSDGTWEACMGATGPVDETCNGADDDCDGSVDEALTEVCGTDTGVCATGVRTCSDGDWGSCTGGVRPGIEVCDAARNDEDCDGMQNEGCDCVDGRTRPCGTDTGACVAGTETCSGGSWGTCVGSTGSSAELCDEPRVDEDCDGMHNEGCACDEGDSRGCGSGSCTGTQTCDITGAWGTCSVTGAGMETCNGEDDDCNGIVDDGAADCAGDTGCTLVRRSGGAPYLLCTGGAGWSSARDACASVGYHLVVIDGSGEQSFLQTETSTLSSGEWWIGLWDEDNDGEYENGEWVAGTSSYRNWNPSNPDHSGQCAMMDNSDSGRWDDKGCGGSKQYICEAP